MKHRLDMTLILATLLLGGCGESANGDGVGGVSASEARALNEAAEMLDARTGAPTAPATNLNPAATNARQERASAQP